MSAPIILYQSKNLLPFFPEGVIKDIYYQLTVGRLRELTKEKDFKQKRLSGGISEKQDVAVKRIISEDIRSLVAADAEDLTVERDDFMKLFQSMTRYAEQRQIFVRDGFYPSKNADKKVAIRVVSEYPWDDLNFKRSLLTPAKKSLPLFIPELYIVNFPDFRPQGIFPEEENIERFVAIGNKESITLLGNISDGSLLLKQTEQIISN